MKNCHQLSPSKGGGKMDGSMLAFRSFVQGDDDEDYEEEERYGGYHDCNRLHVASCGERESGVEYFRFVLR
jgi:hypothetical protein